MIDLPSHLRLGLAAGAHLARGVDPAAYRRRGVVDVAQELGEGVDFTPCELRAALLARACPLWPAVAPRLVEVAVSGDAVVDLGGGLYRRRRRERRRRAMVRDVPRARHGDALVLDECPVELPEPVDQSLRPDGDLGVVVVSLSACAHRRADVDEAGRWAATACIVRELLNAAQHASEAP